jgi:GT2 family glycosyltransferase/SAM-dependent methyltransferase
MPPTPTKSVPRCSIIIPVHNHAALTRQCLDTLLGAPAMSAGVEIIVVDDASNDTTRELLAGYGNRIRTVRHATNTGFGRACNDGAAIASASDYLVFLNNDTIPGDGWLDALVRHADTHPAAAVVGAKLLFPNGTIQHAGVVICQDRYPRHIYAGFPADHPAVSKSRRFQAVTAACALVRRQAFEEAGGFDASFVNGYEDVDLCLRLGAAGHDILYCHESVLCHLESLSRATRTAEYRHNDALYLARWADRVRPDDLDYYVEDGLLKIAYWDFYPLHLEVSPFLGVVGEGDRAQTDRLLAVRAHQVFGLLRENSRLTGQLREVELVAASGRSALGANESRDHCKPGAVTAGRGRADDGRHKPTAGMGFFDDFRPAAGGLRLSGWLLLPDRPLQSYRVFVGGREVGEAERVEREDVARVFPTVPTASRSGFRVVLDPDELSSWVTVAVVGCAGGEPVTTMSFEYDRSLLATLPDPPEQLMNRISLGTTSTAFWLSGLRTLFDLRSALRRHRDEDSIRRILDWGCGCGRVTGPLRLRLPAAEIHGCDIDAEAVEWCGKHIAGVRFTPIGPRPPSPYEDGYFDLILAYSVFTHLTREDQLRWLRECGRILRPGGLLLATVHGPFAAGIVAGAGVRTQLIDSGFSDETMDPRLHGVAPEGYYRCVFQDESYTRRAWGRELSVVEYADRGVGGFQDLVVMRKERA